MLAHSARAGLEDAAIQDPDYATPAHQGHVGAVHALVASPDGQLVVSGGGDAMIRVWRAADLGLLADGKPSSD